VSERTARPLLLCLHRPASLLAPAASISPRTASLALCALSARKRCANADGKRHAAERKQGRAASELVADDCCGGLGGLEAVEASAGGERRALGYFGEVLVEEHPGDEFLA